MKNNTTSTKKSIGAFLSIAAAVLQAIAAAIYCIYAIGLSALNPLVVVSLILAVALNAAYILINQPLPIDIGITEVGAVIFSSIAFITFAQDSLSNLADLINGIQIFSGGTGNITIIVALLVVTAVASVLEIVSCYMDKNKA